MDGETKCRYQVQPRAHSELILSMMDRLLAEAGIALGSVDALAFGCGPGSFTGVRIATGVIQGAALGADLPVVPVSTLAALAHRYYRHTGAAQVLPAYDARVKEVYWAAYRVYGLGEAELVGEEQVSPPEELAVPQSPGWHGVGTGWGTYREVLQRRLGGVLERVDSSLLCSARDVAQLGATGFQAGRAVDAAHALPVYLRNKVAWRR
jgi:tRNA threonylcarbamoyladenosine biosynthesis protein TsaB